MTRRRCQTSPTPQGRCLCLLAGLLAAQTLHAQSQPPSFGNDYPPPLDEEGAAPLDTTPLYEQRRRLDETLWAQEVQAQEYEKTFVDFWDEMLNGRDPYEAFAAFAFNTVTIPQPAATEAHDWGITVTQYGGEGRSLNTEQWRQFLNDLHAQQFRIVETEWHHSQFRVPEGQPPQSVMAMVILADNPARGEKYAIKGDLAIRWSDRLDARGRHVPDVIDPAGVRVTAWKGPKVFTEVLAVSLDPGFPLPFRPPRAYVMAYDLNGDGLSELVLPGVNRLYWNRGRGAFEPEPLWAAAPPAVVASLIADLTGDGLPDLLTANKPWDKLRLPRDASASLMLYPGLPDGRFATAEGRELAAGIALLNPERLVAGDVDADGDLDLFLGQYKSPYLDGQVPTPFYDANDGYPSFLFRSNGDGTFTDVTEAAGLGGKRFRRVFSASLADLDGDGDLDLFTASDFAGADLYLNDGRGRFRDVTDTAFDDRTGFGMGHTFADFNLDGRLDLYMSGMGSTTARRLDDMGLGRADRPDYTMMRGRMGYGNRMYLATGGGTFRQPEFKDRVARAGWAWGNVSLDFDSDGDPDLYVANGFTSKKSSQDYCTTFWTHDIYTGTSTPNPVVEKFFQELWRWRRDFNVSWNGFEHDRVYMNEQGKGFLEVGFLLDIALQADSYAALSDDFDADGRPDLVVSGWAQPRPDRFERVWVYRNEWPVPTHWIGVRLKDEPGRSPIGAAITVITPAGRQIAQMVTGDSFRAQHANLKHFGLGQSTQVDALEVRWLDGAVVRLDQPAIDRYHDIASSDSQQP